MQLIANGNAPTHYANFPDRPSVTVLLGEDDGADIGMVRVDVPAGAGMPPHRHDGSDVIITPVSGAVRVTKDDTIIDVGTGDALLIHKDETVALINPYQAPAELTVITTLRSLRQPASPLSSRPSTNYPEVGAASATRA